MAQKPTVIDLTLDDDDVVSAEERRRIEASIQAKDQAKVKEAQQRQEIRDAASRKRAFQKAQDRELLRSGQVQIEELLSDEELFGKPASYRVQGRVNPNTPTQDLSRKIHTGPSSTQSECSTLKTKSAVQTSDRITKGLDTSRLAINGVNSPSPTKPQHVKDQPNRASMSASKTDDRPKPGVITNSIAPSSSFAAMEKILPIQRHGKNSEMLVEPNTKERGSPSMTESPRPVTLARQVSVVKSSESISGTKVDAHVTQTKSPSFRSADHSPMPMMHRQGPKDNRSVAQGRNRTEASTVQKITSSVKAQIEADSSLLPTPAATPASLLEHVDELDQSVQDASMVPLHTDAIEHLLRRHQETLREYQEALVKHRLRTAQQLHQSFPGPERKTTSTNPFKDLFPGKVTDKKPLNEEKQYRLVMETSCVPAMVGKKPNAICLHAAGFAAIAQYVPKVRSIGRLGASRDLLARNSRILAHIPWFPENEMDKAPQEEKERYAELEQRYRDDIKIRSLQRRCRSMADMWQHETTTLMGVLGIMCEDVVYYMLHTDTDEEPALGTLSKSMHDKWYHRAEDCPNCSSEVCIGPDWRKVANLVVRPPTERRLAMAGLLCAAFYKVMAFNLWHVISGMNSAIKLQHKFLTQLQGFEHISIKGLNTLCYACVQVLCIEHGAYVERDDESSNNDSINDGLSPQASRLDYESSSDHACKSEVPQEEVILDDPELDMNFRKHAALPIRKLEAEHHTCGVFCLDVDIPVAEMLGRQSDGSISGISRLEMQDSEPPTFDDSSLCESKVCFWDTNRREQAMVEMLHQDAETRRLLLGDKEKLYQTLLPMEMTSRRGPCELALAIPGVTCLEIFYLMLCSFRLPAHSVSNQSHNVTMLEGASVDLSNDKTLESRKAFIPALMQVLVSRTSAAAPKIEFLASLAVDVPATVRGDSRAAIVEISGERQDFDLRCKNNRLQLGAPKRTIMGVSEVHGWGLYAGEAIAKSEFITEYRGELISIREGNRRGAVYHNLGLEYLFKLSKDQELDGSRVSNKARFINNSSLTKNINILPKTLLCNGVSRIMLYAARDIAAGEELFYDYGYHKNKRANFKEKPDPVKRTLLAPSLLTNTSHMDLSVATSTAPSLRSEPGFLTYKEDDVDELEDEAVLPTSEHDSEFGLPADATEEFSSDSENSDDSDTPLLKTMSGPSGFRKTTSGDGPITKTTRHQALFSPPPPHSPNERPKKKQRLLVTKPGVARDPNSDSVTPMGRRTTSRTHSDDVQQGKGDSTSRRAEQSRETIKRDDGLHRLHVEESERKRRIATNDKRFGGASQRKAAETVRRRKEAQRKASEQAIAEKLTGRKRQRSEVAISPAQNPRSSQPLTKGKLELSRPKFAAARLSTSPSREPFSPHRPSPDPDIELDQASAPMSESSRSASPINQLASNVALQKSSSSSSTSRQPVPSRFGSESNRSIPHGSSPNAQPVKSADSKQQRRKYVLGYGRA